MNMSSYTCRVNDEKQISQIEKLSTFLNVVGETSRLKLLCILKKHEHCVCELMEQLNMSQSLVSHHLQDLKKIGLVTDDKRGQYIYYKMTGEGKRVTDLIFKILK